MTNVEPTSLSYARPIVRERASVRIESLTLMLPVLFIPGVVLVGIWLMRLGVLDHNSICPSCGGYGAGLFAGLTMLVGTVALFVLGRAIFTGARALRLVIASLALGLAGLEVAVGIWFYQVIQA